MNKTTTSISAFSKSINKNVKRQNIILREKKII